MSTTETDAADESDSQHIPAPDDFPLAYGEASWWPIVAALSAGAIYAGLGLWFMAERGSAIGPPQVGPVVIGLGVVGFLVGLAGWIYQAFVAHFWTREGDPAKFRWGMILFLGTEAFTFGAGFVYYFFIRVGPWPPGELPHLLNSLVAINTVALVASSFTLHFALEALESGNRSRYVKLLTTTLVLGVAFVGGQLYEYYQFVVGEGLGFASGAFYSAFFGLTGLHGLHVMLGVVLIGIVVLRTALGQYDEHHHTSVSTVTMYWHFVDAVWLFLVATLYVGASL